MQVFRTKTFRKHVRKLGVSEEEVKALEEEIAADPATGDVIPGLKGARKIRFAIGGKGKRGGGRAICRHHKGRYRLSAGRLREGAKRGSDAG